MKLLRYHLGYTKQFKQTLHNGRQTGYPAQAGLGREGRVCGSARSPRYGSDPTCALPETRRERGSQGEGEGEGKAANQGNAASQSRGKACPALRWETSTTKRS